MKHQTTKVINNSQANFVFFLAYIGAAIYFVQQSSGFFGFFWALIKAIVWPAILTFNGLEALKI